MFQYRCFPFRSEPCQCDDDLCSNVIEKRRSRIAGDAAVGGNLARYINHACKPNCYTEVVGDTIWIRAARNIRRGEELTYDYSTNGEGSLRCRCRPECPTLF